MKIVVPKTWPEEDWRTPVTPETVRLLIQMGVDVSIESGCGIRASFPDEFYQQAGANIKDGGSSFFKDADLILLTGPLPHTLPTGVHVVGLLGGRQADMKKYRKTQAFSLELLPRISRAQTMDVLSSQNNLRGYCAVIQAAGHIHRLFPMMTTAAGNIAPASVLVLGVGVAGLQAIATAKRLGARVSAMDVRKEAKSQTESLGATFLTVDSNNESGDTASGYAKEMSPSYQTAQRHVLLKALAKADVVICSALIPGKEPPLLLDKEAIHALSPGSLIIDMAADQPVLCEADQKKHPRGNCSLSQRGKTVVEKGVTILAPFHALNAVAQNASTLYAKNLYHFVGVLYQEGRFRKAQEDPLLQATYLLSSEKKEGTRC